jgi:hypothetical protein
MFVPISYDSETSLVSAKISLFAPGNKRGSAMIERTSNGAILSLKFGDEKMRWWDNYTCSSAFLCVAKAARNA